MLTVGGGTGKNNYTNFFDKFQQIILCVPLIKVSMTSACSGRAKVCYFKLHFSGGVIRNLRVCITYWNVFFRDGAWKKKAEQEVNFHKKYTFFDKQQRPDSAHGEN